MIFDKRGCVNVTVGLGLLALFIGSSQAMAGLKVITTTANAAALVKEVGGANVEVESLTKGTQDPHFVDAKPSFMIKVARTDLLVSIGFDLEVGWLPSILRGARNSRVKEGGRGSLVLGNHVAPLEVPTGPVSRDQGDVHPDGNPHFLLDPVRAGKLALVVATRLGELDSGNSATYNQRAAAYKKRMEGLAKTWAAAIKQKAPKQIFTYHKTLTYFLTRMGVQVLNNIEPKPGVPPTAAHILKLIETAKARQIRLSLVENYFDASAALRVQRSAPKMTVRSVPVSVGGAKGVDTLESLYKTLVNALTTTAKG